MPLYRLQKPIEDYTSPIRLHNWFKHDVISTKRHHILDVIDNIKQEQESDRIS